MNRNLSNCVEEVLKASTHPLTHERLLEEIHDRNHRSITKKQLSEYLMFASSNGHLKQVPIPGRDGMGWTLSDSQKRKLGLLAPLPLPVETPVTATPVFDTLYRWQKEALTRWASARHEGMIEAVTGSGKTRLALAAWERLGRQFKPLNALIVVPTIPLMNQWFETYRQLFPGRSVGRIGGGFKDDFSRAPICIAVINSAVKKVDDLLDHCRTGSTKCLLIADECHRYTDAPVFSQIRDFPFDFVMALSATIDAYRVPGFGRIVFSYDFGAAVRDGLVPRFDLVNITVPLTGGERANYDDLTRQIGEQIRHVKMVFEYQLQSVSDDWFFRKLKSLQKAPDGTEELSIKHLFVLLFRRAKIVYTAEHKMRLAKEISELLLRRGQKKMITFFERIDSAEEVQEDLSVEAAKMLHGQLHNLHGVWCRVLHSGLSHADRHDVLNEFKINGTSALLTCRVLDEGLDVPQIDAALLVASTQSRRQRIQRIGRALRKGDGNKRPVVITLHVAGTTDSNVVANDMAMFRGAADIHHANERDCVAMLTELIRKGS